MVRLVLLVILFLLSLLTIFAAPAYYLWIAAILVSEFPLVFVLMVAVLLLAGIKFRKHQWACLGFGLVAIALYVSPIIRAFAVGNSIKDEMSVALGKGSDIDRPPFTFSGLVKPVKDVPFKTLRYVKYADTALTLNYYQNTGNSNRPCVIVIHGGSWAGGDKTQVPELNSYLARKGYNVASIDYRLAPKYKNPVPVDDVKEALKYLTANAAALNIDTNNFVLLGRSAGAQIALLATYTLHDARIKGVIDFYGPADMVWGYSVPANPWVMDSQAVMRNYLGGPYDAIPQKYAASSPLEFAGRGAVPTLIIHGANDVLVAYEHSRRLDLKLEQYNIKHYWLKLPWATHGFDFISNGPGGQLSTYAVERFLKGVVNL